MAAGNSGTLFAASGPMSEDRRKRAFRRLVSDIADSLDDINTRNLHWQVQAPSSLKEKSALDILAHLYKRGSFTEYEVRPLQQLLKDIHREDLTSRVDGFWEEFGRHYSMPVKGMNVRQSGEERRANTFSGSTDNLTNATATVQLSANIEARAPASPTIVAHQETRPEDNDLEKNTLQCHPVLLSRPRQSKSISNSTHNQSLSGDPLSSHPSPSSHPQLLLNHHPSINPSAKSLNNAPSMSEARSGHTHNGACFQSEPCRKMSDVSMFFTQDSSSANSSLLEMRSHSPSKWQIYHIPSDLSSGNVSNENILNCSSREDFLELSGTGVVATMPYQNGLRWYQTSVSSLPTDKHLSGARPMGRSMSHEYYHTPSRTRAAIGCRRSNTFTQADHHPSLNSYSRHCQCCEGYRVRSDSTNACNGRTPHHRLPSPRYYNRSPYLSTRHGGGQCCQHGAGCSNQGNFSESAELAELNQQSCYLPTSSNSSVEHSVMPRGAVGDHDVGWTSRESNCVKAEEGHFATKMSNCKRENIINNNKYPTATVAASHNSNENFVQNDLRGHELNRNENKPHHMIHTAAKKCISEQATTEQPRVYETQTLDQRTIVHKQQVSRSSVQSLEGFPNMPGSKFRARSCSAGNTSAVANSSRSASSVNTLTSSRSALSPVGSPPLNRNHGKSDHHTPSQETSGTPALSSSYQAAMMTSSFQEAFPVPRWKLFLPGHKTTLKPHLVRPDELVWPVKRSKLNKYIYKRKLKLLTCKTSLEVTGDGVEGRSPKISIQLHPYGAEEDRNISVTMKVALELPRKLQLHSESEIEFKVHAKERQNGSSCGDSALELAPSKVVREKVTRNFFYIKEFIKHEALKNSSCEYVQVCVSVALVRQKQHDSD